MAFKMEKEKTRSTPYVLIDEEKGYMKLQGVSFHENVAEFYKDIKDWLGTFLKTDFSCFAFDCELEYFNSSTAKLLLNMLRIMDTSVSDHKKVVVNWITSAENEIVAECGEDFQDVLVNLEFNMVID